MNKKIIPHGPYCYERLDPKNDGKKLKIIGKCPYWTLRDDKPDQENGYCTYLKKGDWDIPGGGLLWDMCKECGENS